MKTLKKQKGYALLVFVSLMLAAASTVAVKAINNGSSQVSRDRITAAALAQAKEALIGYAVSVDLNATSRRPGDLPCPDINNDGVTDTPCGNALGTTGQSLRIGRLPWKTLGLPDLRDGSGERLWYAVSNNFKFSTRTTCTSAGQAGCLNSDTVGTISVFSTSNALVNDGGGNTGTVAVIIAPSEAITRQDSIAQTRVCTLGVDCDVTDKCTAISPTTVPKCNPQNYLDIATVEGRTEDNANFMDGSSTNGFIQGKIKDNIGNVILNDQLLVITQDDIMRPIQKRVAGEVRNCLTDYAAHNYNRYPWAVPITDLTTYDDSSDTYFGRIPDDLGNTKNDGGDLMNDRWEVICNTHTAHTPNPWWINWKEMVFYGLAHGHKPVNPPTTPASCPTCITVNPPSSTADKKFIVIVAGRTLTTTTPPQVRNSSTDKRTLTNYLEDANKTGASPFIQESTTTNFNDIAIFQ